MPQAEPKLGQKRPREEDHDLEKYEDGQARKKSRVGWPGPAMAHSLHKAQPDEAKVSLYHHPVCPIMPPF